MKLNKRLNKMSFALISLILITAILNTSAQLLLKAGMQKIGEFNFAVNNILPVGLKIAFLPFIMTGLVIYVVSVALWLLVLSRVPVGIAYPMTSLAYIFNAIGAYFIFGEHLSYPQVMGIFIIIFGV